jgi:hypothetical protein
MDLHTLAKMFAPLISNQLRGSNVFFNPSHSCSYYCCFIISTSCFCSYHKSLCVSSHKLFYCSQKRAFLFDANFHSTPSIVSNKLWSLKETNQILSYAVYHMGNTNTVQKLKIELETYICLCMQVPSDDTYDTLATQQTSISSTFIIKWVIKMRGQLKKNLSLISLFKSPLTWASYTHISKSKLPKSLNLSKVPLLPLLLHALHQTTLSPLTLANPVELCTGTKIVPKKSNQVPPESLALFVLLAPSFLKQHTSWLGGSNSVFIRSSFFLFSLFSNFFLFYTIPLSCLSTPLLHYK